MISASMLYVAFILLVTVVIISKLLSKSSVLEQELLRAADEFSARSDHHNAFRLLHVVHQHGICNATCLIKAGMLQNKLGNFSSGAQYCKETYFSPWPCSNPDALRCLLSSHLGLADPAEAAAYASKMRDCHLLSEAGKEVVAALQMADGGDHQLQLLRALELILADGGRRMEREELCKLFEGRHREYRQVFVRLGWSDKGCRIEVEAPPGIADSAHSVEEGNSNSTETAVVSDGSDAETEAAADASAVHATSSTEADEEVHETAPPPSPTVRVQTQTVAMEMAQEVNVVIPVNEATLDAGQGTALVLPPPPPPPSQSNEHHPDPAAAAAVPINSTAPSKPFMLSEAEQLAVAGSKPYYNLAMAYLSRGDAVNGLKQLDKVLKKAPRSADALLSRGLLLLEQGHMERAVTDLIALHAIDRTNSTALEVLEAVMQQYIAQARYSQGYEIYALIGQQLMHSDRSAVLLTEMLQEVDQYQQAVDIWLQLSDNGLVTEKQLVLMLAGLYDQMGDTASAEVYYLRAIAVNASTYMDLAKMHLRHGNAGQATALLLKELQSNPGGSRAGVVHQLLGRIHSNSSNLQLAAEHYRAAMLLGVYDQDMRKFFASSAAIHAAADSTSRGEHAGSRSARPSRWVVQSAEHKPDSVAQSSRHQVWSTADEVRNSQIEFPPLLAEQEEEGEELLEELAIRDDAQAAHPDLDTIEGAQLVEEEVEEDEGDIGAAGAATAFSALYQQQESQQQFEDEQADTAVKEQAAVEQLAGLMKRFAPPV